MSDYIIDLQNEFDDTDYQYQEYLKEQDKQQEKENGWEVLDSEQRDGYKLLKLKAPTGLVMTPIIFKDNSDYEKAITGAVLHGWVRIVDGKCSYTDYCKVKRNLLVGETFTSCNGDLISNQ